MGPSRTASRVLARPFTLGVLAAIQVVSVSGALARKKPEQVPRSVRVEVYWGTKKNREAYRAELERSIVADLLEKSCFEQVVEGGKADLVLDVQLNNFDTEQIYDTAETLLPGQGEEHTLLSARASINLDYWLRPASKENQDILSGHIFREIVREPQAPVDPVEQRALRDLTADTSRWVARDLCDRRSRLLSKVRDAGD